MGNITSLKPWNRGEEEKTFENLCSQAGPHAGFQPESLWPRSENPETNSLSGPRLAAIPSIQQTLNEILPGKIHFHPTDKEFTQRKFQGKQATHLLSTQGNEGTKVRIGKDKKLVTMTSDIEIIRDRT